MDEEYNPETCGVDEECNPETCGVDEEYNPETCGVDEEHSIFQDFSILPSAKFPDLPPPILKFVAPAVR